MQNFQVKRPSVEGVSSCKVQILAAACQDSRKGEMMKVEIKSWFTGEILFECEAASLRIAVELALKAKANLRSADLSYANLRSAKNCNKWLVDDLRILLDQPGKIRAYKLVNKKNEGIYNGGLPYEIGETVSVKDANTDESESCASGISLATLPWCMREWRQGYKILVCEFKAKDIAAIPIGTDGKFRVHRCSVVGEKDLVEIGLVNPAKS